MRKYFVVIIYIMLINLILQCKTYEVRSSELDTNPKKCISSSCINLNEYDLYIRSHQSKNIYFNQKSDSLFRTEFQFIFVKNDEVILITTIPSKHIYNQTQVYLINNTKPNAHYFNNFYFGKILYDDKNNIKQFIFQNDENQTKWNLEQKNDFLELKSVDNFKVKEIKKQKKTVFLEDFVIENSFSYKVQYEKNNGYTTIDAENCKTDIFPTSTRKLNYLKIYVDKNRVKKLDLIFTEKFYNNIDKFRFKKGRIKYYIKKGDLN